MKQLILALICTMILTAPVEAKSRHGVCYKLTHMNTLHTATNVVSAPLWVVGFGGAMISGFIGIPILRGVDYFTSHPFVSF